jgi:hypothetical protein
MGGGGAVSEERRSVGGLATLAAGAVIGAVEVVLAISFAALVFGGYLSDFLGEGIGIYLIAAAVTLAILAWRAGSRGVVGSVQDAAAAVLAVVAPRRPWTPSGVTRSASATTPRTSRSGSRPRGSAISTARCTASIP